MQKYAALCFIEKSEIHASSIPLCPIESLCYSKVNFDIRKISLAIILAVSSLPSFPIIARIYLKYILCINMFILVSHDTTILCHFSNVKTYYRLLLIKCKMICTSSCFCESSSFPSSPVHAAPIALHICLFLPLLFLYPHFSLSLVSPSPRLPVHPPLVEP